MNHWWGHWDLGAGQTRVTFWNASSFCHCGLRRTKSSCSSIGLYNIFWRLLSRHSQSLSLRIPSCIYPNAQHDDPTHKEPYARLDRITTSTCPTFAHHIPRETHPTGYHQPPRSPQLPPSRGHHRARRTVEMVRRRARVTGSRLYRRRRQGILRRHGLEAEIRHSRHRRHRARLSTGAICWNEQPRGEEAHYSCV